MNRKREGGINKTCFYIIITGIIFGNKDKKLINFSKNTFNPKKFMKSFFKFFDYIVF